MNFRHPLLPEIDKQVFRDQLGEYFLDDTYKRRGFNIKFDSHFLENMGVQVGYLHGDAGTAMWLLDENIMADNKKARLKALCQRYLSLGNGASYDDAFGLQAWITIDPLVASYYALKDAEFHCKLNDYVEGKLDKELAKLYYDLEIPILNEYFMFERDGMDVDVEHLPRVDAKMTAEIEQLRNEMDALAISAVGYAPAWGSDEEVATFLFDKLDLRRVKGNSVDKNVLASLRDKSPIIPLLSRYRVVMKLKNAFVDALPQFIIDGKIHPSSKTIGSTTGRAAMSDPNLLQAPSKGEGAIIRQTFISGPDYYLVSKDFSGQELGLQAFISGDRALKELIRQGLDFYSEVASIRYGGVNADYTKYGENKKKRDKSKGVVLAMSYGAQAGKVAEVFECSFREGQAFIDNFYRKFSGLKEMQVKLVDAAKKRGYVKTILGRRRHLNFNDPNLEKWQKLEMERQAINSPIQGSATDQIKLSHLLCARHFREKNYKSKVLFSIHDELIFRIHREEYFNTTILQEVDHIMQNAVPMDIPITISTETYEAWGKAVEFEHDDAA